MANDPDADRLGVAQKTGDSWKILSGNELGALLGWWIITNFKASARRVYRSSENDIKIIKKIN